MLVCSPNLFWWVQVFDRARVGVNFRGICVPVCHAAGMRDETIRVRVTTEELKTVDDEAAARAMTRSEVVRLALYEWSEKIRAWQA